MYVSDDDLKIDLEKFIDEFKIKYKFISLINIFDIHYYIKM